MSICFYDEYTEFRIKIIGGYGMLNRAVIDKMLAMPNDKLIMMLKLVMGSAGVDMGDKRIDEKSIKKIRAVLTEISDDDIERITYLISVYKGA